MKGCYRAAVIKIQYRNKILDVFSDHAEKFFLLRIDSRLFFAR
jgi:hypothetical protein